MPFDKAKNRIKIRQSRHARIRRTISGTPERPRLAIRRSLNHIYAQLINDVEGKVVVMVSTLSSDVKSEVSSANKSEAAAKVGKTLGKKAIELGISNVVFDRGGYLYHGRVQALADAAREAGLNF